MQSVANNRSLPAAAGGRGGFKASLLLQAVLGQFIRRTGRPGGEIDAGRLRSGTVVINDNSSGPAIYIHRLGIGVPPLMASSSRQPPGRARRGTVLVQPEEEVIGPSRADIGIEELRPSRAAGGGSHGNRRELLLDRSGRVQNGLRAGHGEPEGVLPGGGIAGPGSAKMDQSGRGIVVVIVVESGLVKVDRGTSRRALADVGCRQHTHSSGIDFDKDAEAEPVRTLSEPTTNVMPLLTSTIGAAKISWVAPAPTVTCATAPVPMLIPV